MVQAARSGVQNIAEGSQASGTSKKMELKLTNVARASLEELRLDYQDYLRQHELSEWSREDPRRGDLITRRPTSADDVARWARDLREARGGEGGSNKPKTEAQSRATSYPEIVANAALALIAVATSLLNRQIASQARAFEERGGFTERLYHRRRRAREDNRR